MTRFAFVATGCLAIAFASPAIAITFPHPAAAENSRSKAILVQGSDVTGFNLQVATYPGGKFEKWGENQWREYGSGAVFNFVETARGETTVMLHDPSRDVYIEIYIPGNEIRYAEGGQQFRFLYPITGIIADNAGGGGQIGDAANVEIVEYTCDEGLPMTVQFEQNGNKASATFSIDTSPPVRLPRVPSGSGAVYSNGETTLSTKGLSAILEGPTGQTRCTQN